MKKFLPIFLALMLVLGMTPALASETPNVPKYVFMFIGDGMGSPQITAAEYYLGALANPDAIMPIPQKLNFSSFVDVGIMTTYDATSFCPDSASTATSMSSGEKTLSGVVNYNVDKTVPFKMITEYAKEAGMKIGVVSSVSVDHATPAAYYAKATARSLYYDIATQAVTGDLLDFLGGGSFLQPTGANKDMANLFELAVANGYTLIQDDDDAIRALTADSGRILASAANIQDSASMIYEIDRLNLVAQGENPISLAEFTQSAINVLDNDDGFFLMVEGGKVDWSGHANDAATVIHDVIAYADAVQVALDFMATHPDDTLIIATGDHETGGLTIGYATTGYTTHLTYLANETMSYVEFDKQIKAMRAEGTSFADALVLIEAAYGLTTTADQPLTLTAKELASIQDAYSLSMLETSQRVLGETEVLLYGGYEPLSMALCHVLNNKAGLSFTSYSHTGIQLPVYAIGVGSSQFNGSYDNTDIFVKLMDIMGLVK